MRRLSKKVVLSNWKLTLVGLFFISNAAIAMADADVTPKDGKKPCVAANGDDCSSPDATKMPSDANDIRSSTEASGTRHPQVYDVITHKNEARTHIPPKELTTSRKNVLYNSDPYERDGKYWLVPPFLIGASSVIVVYIIVHCIYLHCYTKKRMQKLERRTQQTPTIIFGEPGSHGSFQTLTPIVKYEGPYGKTEIAEAQQFLVCEPFDLEDQGQPDGERKKSMQLHLPTMMSGGQRLSICSAGPIMENTPGTGTDRPYTRASICFIPVGRSMSSPDNTSQPDVQNLTFPAVVVTRNPSYSFACGPGNTFHIESPLPASNKNSPPGVSDSNPTMSDSTQDTLPNSVHNSAQNIKRSVSFDMPQIIVESAQEETQK